MKQKYIDLYMDWAKRTSELSHAVRLHVGAVIVKDDCVISYGYNGMPAGWDNTCENKEYIPTEGLDFIKEEQLKKDWPLEDEAGHYRLVTKSEVLHAESNAIAKLARSNNSGAGADIFITHAPCIECAKLIYQSGIKKVFFGKHYRDDSGLKFLEKSGVTVQKVEE